ncbi:hypothetical protein LTR81_027854, partial [Elasticomyces elasticus]
QLTSSAIAPRDVRPSPQECAETAKPSRATPRRLRRGSQSNTPEVLIRSDATNVIPLAVGSKLPMD